MCLLFSSLHTNWESHFLQKQNFPMQTWERRIDMTVSNPLLLHCFPQEISAHSPQILLTSSQYGPCACLSTWTVPPLSDLPLLCPIHPSFSLEYFSSLPRLRTPVRLIVSIIVQLYIQEVLTEHLCGPGTRYSTVSTIDIAFVCIKPT